MVWYGRVRFCWGRVWYSMVGVGYGIGRVWYGRVGYCRGRVLYGRVW